MKEKKEMAHLQSQLKMDDLEFEAFRKRKAVLDAEKEAQDKLNSAAENILGFSINIPKPCCYPSFQAPLYSVPF